MDYNEISDIEALRKRIAELEAEIAKRDATIAQLNDALVKFVSVAGVIGNAVALFPRVQVG